VYTKYVIVANGIKFVVPEDQYFKGEISDILAVYKFPVREKRIGTEIIKSNENK
jgi:hypothetical protein